MKLIIVARTDERDYDEYDSVLVAAHDKQDALGYVFNSRDLYGLTGNKKVTAECIGEAAEHVLRGTILASFNAG